MIWNHLEPATFPYHRDFPIRLGPPWVSHVRPTGGELRGAMADGVLFRPLSLRFFFGVLQVDSHEIY